MDDLTPRLVLVLNAGSSSLKYRAVAPATGAVVVTGVVERLDGADISPALDRVRDEMRDAGCTEAELLAIGHRVVHGGADFHAPTVVDDAVLARIEALSSFAPLHNPPAVAGIRSALAAYPHLPQVAVFDTGFFHDLPAHASTYAIDVDLAAQHRIRRYGAHGTSHAWVAARTAELLGRDPQDPLLRVVVLHLGNGASACAVRGGRPVDTSMGLTPLEGLVMGTRAGDLDPGVLLHLAREADLSTDRLEDLLHHQSGLAGLTGSSDVRDVLDAVERGEPAAELALAVYCHRIRKYVGAYLAVLGGADAVVFTAGVGEHSPRVRADSLAGLEELGIELDEELNESGAGGPRRVSSARSRVAVLVVPTNEELAIAEQVAALVGT